MLSMNHVIDFVISFDSEGAQLGEEIKCYCSCIIARHRDVGQPSLFVVALQYMCISSFPQVECTFSNIPTSVHLPIGGLYLQCMPIIFMTHWSFSVILSSHIGNPSEFVSVMTDGPM